MTDNTILSRDKLYTPIQVLDAMANLKVEVGCQRLTGREILERALNIGYFEGVIAEKKRMEDFMREREKESPFERNLRERNERERQQAMEKRELDDKISAEAERLRRVNQNNF
jgi:hypothetical protein